MNTFKTSVLYIRDNERGQEMGKTTRAERGWDQICPTGLKLNLNGGMIKAYLHNVSVHLLALIVYISHFFLTYFRNGEASNNSVPVAQW